MPIWGGSAGAGTFDGDAADVPFTPTEDILSEDVQAAVEEVHAAIATEIAAGFSVFVAADVPFTPAGTISATNVQAAIEEVAYEAGSGVSALGDLSDVGTATPTDGHVLVGDGDSFESRALVLADISDVGETSGAADGDTLVWDTDEFVARALAVTELSDYSGFSVFVTPDPVFRKAIHIGNIHPGEAITIADGKARFVVPSSLNGMNLVRVAGWVETAGTTGTMDIQIRNATQTADMLSTKLKFASTAVVSDGNEVIDTANDDVATGDVLYVDVDAVHTTPAEGELIVVLEFALPAMEA